MPGAQFIISGDRADSKDIDLINKWQNDNNFPLIKAIAKNRPLDEIRQLIAKSTNESAFAFWIPSVRTYVNYVNKDGVTALHVAIICGNLAVVTELLQHQAEVNILMKMEGRRYAPLHLAIANSPALSEPNSSSAGASAKPRASLFPEILKKLLAYKEIQCNLVGELGRTPLHTAAHFQCSWAMQQLLDKDGINLNPATAKSDGNKTPLHICAFIGNLEVCRQLLRKGADMFVKDANGQAPFHNAIFMGAHPEVAELLLDQISTLSQEQAGILVDLMVDVIVSRRKNPDDPKLSRTEELFKFHALTRTVYPEVSRRALLRIQEHEQTYRLPRNDVDASSVSSTPTSNQNSDSASAAAAMPSDYQNIPLSPPDALLLSPSSTTSGPVRSGNSVVDYRNIPPSLFAASSLSPSSTSSADYAATNNYANVSLVSLTTPPTDPAPTLPASLVDRSQATTAAPLPPPPPPPMDPSGATLTPLLDVDSLPLPPLPLPPSSLLPPMPINPPPATLKPLDVNTLPPPSATTSSSSSAAATATPPASGRLGAEIRARQTAPGRGLRPVHGPKSNPTSSTVVSQTRPLPSVPPQHVESWKTDPNPVGPTVPHGESTLTPRDRTAFARDLVVQLVASLSQRRLNLHEDEDGSEDEKTTPESAFPKTPY